MLVVTDDLVGRADVCLDALRVTLLGLVPWSADEFLAIHNEAVDERSSPPDLRVTLIRDGEEETLASS